MKKIFEQNSRRVLLSSAAFFGLLLALLLLSAGGHIVVGDEETMFRVTQSLLSGKGLAISQEQLTVPPLAKYGFLPREVLHLQITSAVQGRQGVLYSKYGIGQSLAAIPFYLAGEWLGRLSGLSPVGEGGRLAVSMLNALALAATGWLLARFAQDLGWRRSTGRWLAIAALFGAFAWPYVKTFYPQPSVGLLLLAAVYCAYRWRIEINAAWLWAAGLALGGMILFHISEAVLLPVILAYLFLSSSKDKRWAWVIPVGIPVAAALVLTGAYNWLRFGSFFSTGYAEAAWDNPPLYGLFGLLLSPGKGVFFYAPLLVLSLGAWKTFARRQRAEAWLIAGIWLSLLAFFAPYRFWTGGWNWGPRFLLPALPLGLLPSGIFLESVGNTHSSYRLVPRVLFGVFLTLGIFLQLPAVLVDHSRYLYMDVIGSPDPEAYTRTILQPQMSPLWRQWPTALERLRFFSSPDGWQKASLALDGLTLYSVVQPASDAPALLQAEFLRSNTLDLWWLDRGMTNPSLPVWWAGLPWILLALAVTAMLATTEWSRYQPLETSADPVEDDQDIQASAGEAVPPEPIGLPVGVAPNSE